MHVSCYTNTSSTANIVNTSSNDDYNNNNDNKNHSYPKSIASALFSYNTPSFSNARHNRSSYNIRETDNVSNTSPSSLTPIYSNINTNNVVVGVNVNTNNVVLANNNSINMHVDNALHQTTSTTFSSSPSILSAALPHSLPIPQDQQQQQQQQ